MMKHALCVPGSVMAILAAGAPAFGMVFNDLDTVIQAHRDRQQELADAQGDILARADTDSRELTTEERTELDELANEFDRLEGEITRRERALNQAASLTLPAGRVTDPEDPDEEAGGDPPAAAVRPVAAAQGNRPANGAARSTVPARPRTVANGTHGFRNFGEFALSVARHAAGNQTDPRLMRNAAASTISSEGAGADGGFAVPPDYRNSIMEKVFGEDSLLARTDRQVSTSNSITFPTDMTTPWDSSGGIQAYWTAEESAITQSKVSLQEVTVKAHKLACLVPVTEELFEDAPALDGYLRRKVPEKMDFKISNALVRGNGVGQPLGFLNSPCLVTQAAEGSQTADTINANNVVKMLSRLPVSSRGTAIWLIHPDAEPQLPLMTIGDQPVYIPPGGLRDAPYGTLLGRPVIPHQVCETVGDLGDVMLVDFAQYLTLTKTGGGRDANGMRSDISMHLWFDQDLLAFKTTVRVGGQPWWSSTTAMRDGSSTQSPFVVLAARA